MKVVGYMVCGRGEADRYLDRPLKEFARLCDDAVIVGNNTDAKTESLIKSYGYWFYRDDRTWGVDQPRIKMDLAKKVALLRPDIVIPLDADERFDSTFDRAAAERWSIEFPACYFYCVNLWNDEDHQRKALGFWNVRMYRFTGDTQFQMKNLHCGLAPASAYHYGAYIPHLFIHYGLMMPEDRAKKVERYEQFDPNAKYKDQGYYDALKTDTDGVPFLEFEMLAKVREEYQKTGSQHKQMHEAKQREFVMVRRLVDGKMLDMSKEEWEAITRDKVRSKQFELLGLPDDPGISQIVEPPKVEVAEFACPVCGKESKTKAGFEKHRKTHLK